jgi:hypothetical protein
MLPLIVAITFIFEGAAYAVGVSVAWLGVGRIRRAPTTTIETSERFIPVS